MGSGVFFDQWGLEYSLIDGALDYCLIAEVLECSFDRWGLECLLMDGTRRVR